MAMDVKYMKDIDDPWSIYFTFRQFERKRQLSYVDRFVPRYSSLCDNFCFLEEQLYPDARGLFTL